VEIRSYNLKSGTREGFHRLFEREALPLLRRFDVDVVAYGPSLHDEDSYFLIRSFPSVEDRQRSEDEPAMHGGGHALADREQEREADESAEGGDSKGQDEAARRQRQPEREGQGRGRNTAKECPQHRYREGFDLLGGKLGQHWRRPPHHHDCQRESEGQPVGQWSGRAFTHPQLG